MAQRFVIRPLTPEDTQAFQRLRLFALCDSPTSFAASEEEEAASDSARIAERLAPRGGSVVLGAVTGLRLDGIVGLRRETPGKVAHKAVLWGMFVLPESRRHGIGDALLSEALATARRWSVLQVNLTVNEQNASARSLYEQHGFIGFGFERRSLIVNGQFDDERWMVRDLSGHD